MAIDTKEPKELFLVRKTFGLLNAYKRFDTLLEIERERHTIPTENMKTLELQRYKTLMKLELQLRGLQAELRGGATSEDETD